MLSVNQLTFKVKIRLRILIARMIIFPLFKWSIVTPLWAVFQMGILSAEQLVEETLSVTQN